jgi:hypothetical protein
MKNKKIIVQGSAITYYLKNLDDFISLTDIAKYRNELEPFSVINNWKRSRSTIEFISIWEKLKNTNFKPIEFERLEMKQAITILFFLLKDGLSQQWKVMSSLRILLN